MDFKEFFAFQRLISGLSTIHGLPHVRLAQRIEQPLRYLGRENLRSHHPGRRGPRADSDQRVGIIVFDNFSQTSGNF